MDSFGQSLASTSRGIQGDIRPTSESENCSNLIPPTIKVEPHESGVFNFSGDLNYSRHNNLGNRANISENDVIRIFPPHSNIVSDVKPFSLFHPIVIETLKTDIKEPIKITHELVSYRLENLTAKREDIGRDDSEGLSFLHSENETSCKNYNYSETNEANERENGVNEGLSFYSNDLTEPKVFDESNVEDSQFLTACAKISPNRQVGHSSTDLVTETDDVIVKREEVTTEPPCYCVEDELVYESSISCKIEEKAPSCQNTLLDCKEFTCSDETIATINLVEKIEEKKNITSEFDCPYPQDMPTDGDDKPLLKVIKVEDDQDTNYDHSSSSFISSGVSNETKVKGLSVMLEDLFQPTQNKKPVHTAKKTCLCIFCLGSVRVRIKSPGVLEITSCAKPNECLIIREKPFYSASSAKMQQKPKLKRPYVRTRGKVTVCTRCPAVFSFKKDWLEHLRTAHPDEKPYTCTQCLKKFRNLNNLSCHKKTHLSDRPFSCPLCPSTFKYKANLKGHLMRHGDQKPFLCPRCPAAFKHRTNLNGHLARHSDEKKFVCAHCPTKFSVKEDLSRHLAIHSQKRPFACSQCSTTFKKRSDWRVHEKRKHSNEKLFSCAHCSYRANLKEAVKNHLRTHSGEKPFLCVECPCKFFTLSNLKRHEKITHSDIRPFVCALCPFKCKIKPRIVNHMRLHTGEKPYVCNICPAAYTVKGSLIQHTARHHSDNKRSHECNYCPKKYFTNHELNRHVKRHVNEKSVTCQRCSARFHDNCGLKNHLRTVHATSKLFCCSVCPLKFKCKGSATAHIQRHSDEKPFLCPKCPARFNCSASLKSHSLVHTSKKPYICAHCSSRFKSKDLLRTHMKKHLPQKSVSCLRCLVKFKTAGGLRNHLPKHNSESPYACEHCESKFKSKNEIRTHLVNKHSDERPHLCSICPKKYKRKSKLNFHLKKHRKK